MGRVGDARGEFTGKIVDRTLTLIRELDDLGSAPAGQGRRYLGKGIEERFLVLTISHPAMARPAEALRRRWRPLLRVPHLLRRQAARQERARRQRRAGGDRSAVAVDRRRGRNHIQLLTDVHSNRRKTDGDATS